MCSTLLKELNLSKWNHIYKFAIVQKESENHHSQIFSLWLAKVWSSLKTVNLFIVIFRALIISSICSYFFIFQDILFIFSFKHHFLFFYSRNTKATKSTVMSWFWLSEDRSWRFEWWAISAIQSYFLFALQFKYDWYDRSNIMNPISYSLTRKTPRVLSWNYATLNTELTWLIYLRIERMMTVIL